MVGWANSVSPYWLDLFGFEHTSLKANERRPPNLETADPNRKFADMLGLGVSIPPTVPTRWLLNKLTKDSHQRLLLHAFMPLSYLRIVRSYLFLFITCLPSCNLPSYLPTDLLPTQLPTYIPGVSLCTLVKRRGALRAAGRAAERGFAATVQVENNDPPPPLLRTQTGTQTHRHTQREAQTRKHRGTKARRHVFKDCSQFFRHGFWR